MELDYNAAPLNTREQLHLKEIHFFEYAEQFEKNPVHKAEDQKTAGTSLKKIVAGGAKIGVGIVLSPVIGATSLVAAVTLFPLAVIVYGIATVSIKLGELYRKRLNLSDPHEAHNILQTAIKGKLEDLYKEPKYHKNLIKIYIQEKVMSKEPGEKMIEMLNEYTQLKREEAKLSKVASRRKPEEDIVSLEKNISGGLSGYYLSKNRDMRDITKDLNDLEKAWETEQNKFQADIKKLPIVKLGKGSEKQRLDRLKDPQHAHDMLETVMKSKLDELYQNPDCQKKSIQIYIDEKLMSKFPGEKMIKMLDKYIELISTRVQRLKHNMKVDIVDNQLDQLGKDWEKVQKAFQDDLEKLEPKQPKSDIKPEHKKGNKIKIKKNH